MTNQEEHGEPRAGMLDGVTVVEIADEQAEYAGLLLAGLGATVIKVEPPGGSPTRRIGPFLDDVVDPEHSLYFWQYNRGKRSVVLDLDRDDDQARLRVLLEDADVLLDSTRQRYLSERCFDRDALCTAFPSLVVARMSPFGDSGPWVDYQGSDLVHLALGGPVMNCGYDPEPGGGYDLSPIAPQMWHAYHIAGEQLAAMVMGALYHRERTGTGQYVSCAVHQAVATNTELDVMNWIMRRAPMFRQTCRHAMEAPALGGGPMGSMNSMVPNIGNTKDGRWLMVFPRAGEEKRFAPFLQRYGMAADLTQVYGDKGAGASGAPLTQAIPGSESQTELVAHALEVMHRFIKKFSYARIPWREAQEAGILFAPLRKPHENASDPHWLMRGTFQEVEHREVGRSFVYPVSKWISSETSWSTGRRAPFVDEDGSDVFAQREPRPKVEEASAPAPTVRLSKRGRPFALDGVRILDFSWFLATAGGTKFLAAMGAESIKVEWKGHPDSRMGAMAPRGGRDQRRTATAPLSGVKDPDMGGQFNNKNAGKRGISLNVRDPRGLAIAKELVKCCDVVAEGFSPGTMESWGLGYEVMRELNPRIIYAQQSAMGTRGVYGRMRALGPVAAAFAGTSEMSGLPEPAMPAGWGYSYLDWIGAYSFASALLGALYYRERTGRGQWIDASQVESGIFITGTAALEWSANGRPWQRFGNRSPYKVAAPHGIYPCRGDDRWIAIACFTQSEWRALCEVAGTAEFVDDPRFSDLENRVAHQDALDAAVASWTSSQDRYELMHTLQGAGIAAGVCQTGEDRCDRDPQLESLEWLTEVTGTKIGTWPIPEVAVKMSETPPYVGGAIDRGAPCYAEDNAYVYGEILGMPSGEIEDLARDGVI